MRLLLIVCLIVWHTVNVVSFYENRNCDVSDNELYSATIVDQTINNFSINLFQSKVFSNLDNVICSPYTTFIVIAAMAYSKKGSVKNDLLRGLNIPLEYHEEHFKCGIQDLINYMRDFGEFYDILSLVTTVKNDNSPLNPTIEQTTFKELIPMLDFEDRKINGKEIVSDVVSGFALKKDWVQKFIALQTRAFGEEKPGVPFRIPFVFMDGYYNYGTLPKSGAKFIELPLESNGINPLSLIIVLPAHLVLPEERLRDFEAPGYKDYVKNITVDQLLAGRMTRVHVLIPKFSIETQLNLRGFLEKLGLSDKIFKSAGFTRIASLSRTILDENGYEVRINSQVTHKMKVTSNPIYGLKALAGPLGLDNAAGMRFGHIKPELFIADRPFAFFLVMKGQYPVIIHVGQFAKPIG